MAIFDINYSQKTPSGQSGNALIGNMPSTGTGDIGRAVSGFGGAMYEVGQKIQTAQDAMDLSVLNRQGEEMDLAAEQTLRTITDADEQEKFIQAHEQKRATVAAKSNSRVQNAYQINHNNNTADRQRRFYSVGLQARAKDAEDKGRFAYQSAVDSGNEFEARKINALRLATETIGKEEYASLEANLPVDIKFAQAIKMSDVDLNKAEEIISGMKDLTAEQTVKKDSIMGHFNALRNRKNSALAEQQDKEKYDLWKKAEAGTLVDDDLNKSVLSAEDKIYIQNNFQAVQAAKAKGEVTFLEQGDPALVASINAAIDLTPEKVNEAGLYQLAANGLGTKNVTQAVDRLRTNLKAKNPIDTKYRAHLSSLYTANVFGKRNTASNAMEASDKYMDASRKLDAFLATNPTDEQAQKFVHDLIREKSSVGFLSSVFTPPIYSIGKVLMARRSLAAAKAEKEIDVFQYTKVMKNPTTGKSVGWDGEKWQPID